MGSTQFGISQRLYVTLAGCALVIAPACGKSSDSAESEAPLDGAGSQSTASSQVTSAPSPGESTAMDSQATTSALPTQSATLPAASGSAPSASGSGAGSGTGSGGAPGTGGVTDPPSASGTAGAVVDAGVPGPSGSNPSASTADAGATGCAPFVMPDDCTIPENAVLPGELRCTGLYEDWATRELACGVRTYAPAYALWSDGADKVRYVYLPPGTQIDVTNPDDFRYPVGTQFWKEFYIPDAGGTRLGETRLMRKVSAGWLYTSYVWNEDGSNAIQQNEGVGDLFGSGHSVPARQQCKECHSGRPDFILGWDALMLGTGATGITRDDLLDEGLLTWDGKDTDAPHPLDLEIPGDDVERAALGYLHANCGVSCHNDSSKALALETGFFTRLDHTALGSVQEAPVLVTGFNRVPNPNAPLMDLSPPANGGEYVDLRPLDPERSLTLVRMQIRDNDAAMPRMGTNFVDDAGVALVREWIEQMTPERGYPAP